ncbi:response regulator [Pseudoalteromonas sp. B530]|uniref:response regulator n=1 Tax=Pseudoalteromonas sp. B530 TaxID=2994390 RepID=UPI00224B9F64|nr:response regulator [Pseudoalteromonas sp. B530]MCX2769775.1 response regulator [Pseudoalteromonas sp. B530]
MQNNDITVLVVEDDDIDYMTVKRSFAKRKIMNPMVRAIDGVEALEFLQTKKIEYPFIVLLDLKMPRMGGLEFLARLREDPELKDTVVFVLTTSKDEDDIHHSYEKNVAGYFLKEEASNSMMSLVDMLDGYWRIVQFPTK